VDDVSPIPPRGSRINSARYMVVVVVVVAAGGEEVETGRPMMIGAVTLKVTEE